MTEAKAGRLRPIGHAEKTLRLMLGSTVAFGAGSAAGMMVRNWIENPPEIPAIASAPTGPLTKDLVAPDPGITVFAEPTPSGVLAADSSPTPSSTAVSVAEFSTTRPSTSTAKEIPPTLTPLREMVATENVDVFLGPGERKVGYFVPGQKFTPTGVTSGDYTQVSDGKNILWVKSGGSYQAIDEVPQVASRPPASEPPQDAPTARPPTQAVPAPTRAPETAPTATRTPEIVRAFPKEIRLEEGLTIFNFGTRYGIDINDGGFRDPDGTYAPGGSSKGYDSGMRQDNLNYVKAMFAKYRNLPNGGKGRALEIFFYDSPQGYPFIDKSPYVPRGNDGYYRYGQLVGNTIEVHIGLGENFGPALKGSLPWQRIMQEIDANTVRTFLLGNHDFAINRLTTGNKTPVPREIDFLSYPTKFDLITSRIS